VREGRVSWPGAGTEPRVTGSAVDRAPCGVRWASAEVSVSELSEVQFRHFRTRHSLGASRNACRLVISGRPIYSRNSVALQNAGVRKPCQKTTSESIFAAPRAKSLIPPLLTLHRSRVLVVFSPVRSGKGTFPRAVETRRVRVCHLAEH
jgi:hypothetical protein